MILEEELSASALRIDDEDTNSDNERNEDDEKCELNEYKNRRAIMMA